jgi:hypothetical protein
MKLFSLSVAREIFASPVDKCFENFKYVLAQRESCQKGKCY